MVKARNDFGYGGAASLDFTVYRSTGYTVTINYHYENGTAAANPYTAVYPYEYSYAVISPTITGYTASIPLVQGVIGLEDIVVNVIYTRNPSAITPGDVDGDGSVSATDAVIVLRMGMGIIPTTNLEATDIDRDGIVSVADALLILRMAMGM